MATLHQYVEPPNIASGIDEISVDLNKVDYKQELLSAIENNDTSWVEYYLREFPSVINEFFIVLDNTSGDIFKKLDANWTRWVDKNRDMHLLNPLLMACYLGHVDTAKTLINRGADVNKTIHKFRHYGDRIYVVEFGAPNGTHPPEDLDECDEPELYGMAPLNVASYEMRPTVIEYLLGIVSVDIEAINARGWTPVYTCTRTGSDPISELEVYCKCTERVYLGHFLDECNGYNTLTQLLHDGPGKEDGLKILLSSTQFSDYVPTLHDVLGCFDQIWPDTGLVMRWLLFKIWCTSPDFRLPNSYMSDMGPFQEEYLDRFEHYKRKYTRTSRIQGRSMHVNNRIRSNLIPEQLSAQRQRMTVAQLLGGSATKRRRSVDESKMGNLPADPLRHIAEFLGRPAHELFLFCVQEEEMASDDLASESPGEPGA